MVDGAQSADERRRPLFQSDCADAGTRGGINAGTLPIKARVHANSTCGGYESRMAVNARLPGEGGPLVGRYRRPVSLAGARAALYTAANRDGWPHHGLACAGNARPAA